MNKIPREDIGDACSIGCDCYKSFALMFYLPLATIIISFTGAFFLAKYLYALSKSWMAW